MKGQIAKIQEYCQTGRTLANYTIVAPESDRARGVNVDLSGGRRQPLLLVERCEVSGLMRDDGNAYTMTGVVENMTNEPELLDKPLRAQLQLEGPQLLKVDYVRDRRNQSDIDLVTLHWPACAVPETSLGKDADAMVYLAGGNREVWVQLRTEGENVSGRFISKQTGTRIRLEVDFEVRFATGDGNVAAKFGRGGCRGNRCRFFWYLGSLPTATRHQLGRHPE